MLFMLAIVYSPNDTHAAPRQSHRIMSLTTVQRIFAPLQKPIVAIATAYYRPIQGQIRYVTGSYQGDIRLNGAGTTFSGKPVQIGHLAADLRYHPVGTTFHVFVDGADFGLWTVTDSGSAIKGPRRFDFFMGESDAGRVAALAWGRGNGKRIIMYPVGRRC